VPKQQLFQTSEFL